jgi:hypothetical protein
MIRVKAKVRSGVVASNFALTIPLMIPGAGAFSINGLFGGKGRPAA